MKLLKAILKDENGQGMVEYGLILGLISIAAIAAIVLIGPKIKETFSAAEKALPSAPPAS